MKVPASARSFRPRGRQSLRIALLLLAVLPAVSVNHAGDILRGGATAAARHSNANARATAGAAEADAAKTRAQDRLARTTAAITAVRNMQRGATTALVVPDGLVPGGLQLATGLNARWDGAQAPIQSGNTVSIKQTQSQAVLHWETFNVGRNTTVNFDQSAGQSDAGKWIAFNKVFDPSGVPSKILGSIKAQGQVYILNQNGILFGAGSQVNVRTLVASALPINDNLVNNGLLNNRDAQFLFSGLDVPGGSDGSAPFIPPAPPPGGRYGDVVVHPGALLQSPVSVGGNGGRVMLVGANVRNEGVISTPSGQTILAAGLQVGVQAHSQDDPSLRGLDAWVGAVGDYAGIVTNSGLIQALTGSVLVVGKEINQRGAIDSSTSVTLNGRIDLLASYGAVANPNFDNSGSPGFGGPPFVNQFTGSVELGVNSAIRILPELGSTEKIPGLALPERSRVNIEGIAVHFGENSTLLVPSGSVEVRAGTWPYVDIDNNRTVFLASGDVESSLPNFLRGSKQIFFFDRGQVYVDQGALLDVSGSTMAFVPLSQYLLTVQLRGAELADSPLLRNSNVRGLPLVVDLSRSGIYGGREWVGTPLGDLTGLVNITERDVAQLTAGGGSIDIQAGNSVVVRQGATLDVSGGLLSYEGGKIQTTRFLRGRNLIDIHDATPDVTYDGVYDGMATETSQKWGVSSTFRHALAPLGAYVQKPYVAGAPGGTLTFTAPSLVLEGTLLGQTIKGPRQQDAPPVPGSLVLNFRGEKRVDVGSAAFFLPFSPSPPEIRIVAGGGGGSFAPSFSLVNGVPEPIAPGVANQFVIGTDIYSEEGGGFGHLEIDNREGDVVVGGGQPVRIPAGGSLVAQAANIFVNSDILAPGGTVSFTAMNFSPFLLEELQVLGIFGLGPAPVPVDDRGLVALAAGTSINVAGMIVDDRPTAVQASVGGRAIDGGSITLEGYAITLPKNSLLDASGGVWAKPTGGFQYGRGGDIAVLAGQDPVLSTSIGGKLVLEGTLQAYGKDLGGTLALKANQIQIGGGAAPEGGLLIEPDFFRQGGFRSFSLTGIGGRDAAGDLVPAIRVAAGTVLEPVSENYVLTPYARPAGQAALRPYLKPVGIRPATSLSLEGIGADDGFTTDRIEAIGLVVLEEGTRITTDPGARVSVKGQLVSVMGTIDAPGGSISITGAGSYPVAEDLISLVAFALPTVYIGPEARLSAAGTTVFLPDPFGRKSGLVYPGGSIVVSGNIIAEAGAVLDVSGASAVLDFHPSRLGGTALPLVPRNAGLNSKPWALQTVPVRVDSDGGFISLVGSEMLYSDATLRGEAGGPTALGGTLSVDSGRFYADGEIRTSADINLVVEQSGNAAAFGNTAVFGNIPSLLAGKSDLGTLFAGGNPNRGIGYFSLSQFESGGFGSLDLGFKFFDDANPIPFGGNVQFRGPIRIVAPGFVRVAGGGVIQADSTVSIAAPYVALGQEFRPPLNPGDVFRPFVQFNPAVSGADYFFPPTTGPGSLTINANLIDVGTLSLQGIGRALLAADGGDIRGNGTLNIAGDLTLRSAQVYPTTLAAFNIFAYDPPGGVGSVTILQSGARPLPLSAGGSINIFASQIRQAGTLRAPLGSIVLGWDGTDLDPSTAALDQPIDPVGGFVFNSGAGQFDQVNVPVADLVTLAAGSVTSVSAVDPASGEGLLIPFGISPDGLSWIDPRGVNVTVGGLPARGVSLSGNTVVTEAGSTIDLRGGGDLLAYRWVQGNGGSVDILGSALSAWGGGVTYQAGDLVEFEGETWSARVAIDPADFATSPSPSESRYWTLVPESYAVVPGFDSTFAPFNLFNTGVNSTLLGGDPGYMADSLRLGEQIYLEGSPGLAAGSYTLLPRRYALLPGAYLVIPREGMLVGSATPRSTTSPALGSSSIAIGTASREEGSNFVSGYTFNSLHQTTASPEVFSRFEVVSPGVLAERAEYAIYSANDFLTEAAKRLDVGDVQRLPTDSARLAIHGNDSLRLGGGVLSRSISGGRGTSIDVSSFSDIFVIGGNGSAPGGAQVVLDADLLRSWGAESLLIGGLRRETPDGTSVEVRTNALTLDNPGSVFSGPDITLVSRMLLTMTDGSALAAGGGITQPAEKLLISGDGTLLRVSSDSGAEVVRSGLTGSVLPLLGIGAGASLAGGGVILDSTYASDVDPTVSIDAIALFLASGQISILLEPQVGPLPGTLVDPHLVLDGNLLTQAEAADRLTLQSYRSIDIYGDGTFGRPDASSLRLLSAGIRGFASGPSGAMIQGRDIVFGNPVNVASPGAAPGPLSGSLTVNADTVRLGENAFAVSGYEGLTINAAGGFLPEQDGAFSTLGNLTVATPLITASQGVNHTITAGGDLALLAAAGPSVIQGGLGATLGFQGSTVTAATDIFLPSGALSLRATSGDLDVTGDLSVEGSALAFYDLVRYSDAGRIDLIADAGNIALGVGSRISVAAASGGGNAGTLSVRSPNGTFSTLGLLEGHGGADGLDGTFLLDAGTVASFADLDVALDDGGFFEKRSFRIRTGDVTIAGTQSAKDFSLSLDGGGGAADGNILVTGIIDSSGLTGGSIFLSARGNLTIAPSAVLTVAAQHFNSAGKGGHIQLEAGAAINGAANTAALLDLQAGSEIDLSVADFVAGDYQTYYTNPDGSRFGSSAFHGQFEGTLHLRAPRNGAGLQVDSIDSTVVGGSSVLVEAYRIYDRTASGGVMDITLRNQIDADNSAFMTGEAAMLGTLLGGGLDPALLVLAPGVEIINRTGDLTLGTANNTASGSTNIEAQTAADWDLSGFRYGAKAAPGILTLRAQGDLVFNNALSDGFSPVSVNATNGFSSLWLANPMTIDDALPVNTQSWSFRLAAGADFGASDFRAVLSPELLQTVQPGKGSVLVGEFYPAITNSFTAGTAAGQGSAGQTADHIRIALTSSDSVNRGTRYEVIRTGTGDIQIAAGRDVQLRNQFASIYTAGVALPNETTIFDANDFVVPIVNLSPTRHPSQGNLGEIQQRYSPAWTMSGGGIQIAAQGSIRRTTLAAGNIVDASSLQVPSNWLYRRGYVDDTGLFAVDGGVDGATAIQNVRDGTPSTTWWIDFSNFFEGVGALGGGDITLTADSDIINVDALIPTSARMVGRDPVTTLNVAPDEANLLEHGGGDLVVRAGRNISGGIYYVERGWGELFAGGEITTNAARSPSLQNLGSTTASASVVQSQNPAIFDSRTWLPTTLFVGKSGFDVRARGDVLLGPIANAFLLPQGLNNKFWYKTYFQTYSENAEVNVSSLGGDVTHRLSATPPGGGVESILGLWLRTQNLFAGVASSNNASNFQPWIRLAELDVSQFSTALTIAVPTLRSTAFTGDINVVGNLNLFPSPTGSVELAAAGAVVGLQSTGRAISPQGQPVTVWTSAAINLSDASPQSVPGITSPLAYQSLSTVGRNLQASRESRSNPFPGINAAFSETGSFSGDSGSIQVKRALHDPDILHRADPEPLRIYSQGGDITGLTLFSAKFAQILAGNDITDIAFYLQNVRPTDVSIVSAGRDIVPNNENAPLRSLANNLALGNLVDANQSASTVAGTFSNALPGDIQASGPGFLEVLAGRNVDLGTGPNFADGTGVGVTTIGNSRNPFLPFEGAGVVLLAGVGGIDGEGPALGLTGSSLNLEGLLDSLTPASSNNEEVQAIEALDAFFGILKQVGQDFVETSSYDKGFAAIAEVFGNTSNAGEIFTRSRDIRTVSGGGLRIAAPNGGLTLASDIFGNPLTPPGIVTEFGGDISVFTKGSVDIGRARIFTLRGGDITMWSSFGDIAAGTSPKTVVTAPPTRVLIDSTSADVQTDLGGLATGGGIGTLKLRDEDEASDVTLVAPEGTVDAGDAGIQATGNITLAAAAVQNADNISAAGASVGVPTAAVVAAPNVSGLSSASSATGAANSSATQVANQARQQPTPEETPSIIAVEVLGYGGEDGTDSP